MKNILMVTVILVAATLATKPVLAENISCVSAKHQELIERLKCLKSFTSGMANRPPIKNHFDDFEFKRREKLSQNLRAQRDSCMADTITNHAVKIARECDK